MIAPVEVQSKIIPFIKSNFIILFCLMCAAAMCTAAPFMHYHSLKKEKEAKSSNLQAEENGLWDQWGDETIMITTE